MPRGERFILLLLTMFLTATWGAASNQSSLEKRLKRYLTHRFLVFRQLDVHGSKVGFNSSGQLMSRERSTPRSTRTGILYLDLELGPERLLLLGEPVEIVFKGGKHSFVRDPRTLKLMTCTVILDVPLDQMTFEKAVVALAKVFLTKQEFEEIVRLVSSGGSGGGSDSNSARDGHERGSDPLP